jgi:4-amino-4-deoxy-L-arabinose transferase-like glycosyltransferase
MPWGSRLNRLRPAFGPAVAVLVCVGCLAPFADKAFYIDDPLFLWAARHIRQHPTDPYGFTVNWYGYPQRMADNTKNPPLACYALALAGTLFGWGERALHLALLLPAAGVAWGTYRLAEGLCTRPLLATLMAVLTPVFLVSSTNVMCDTLMLCFWVWAVVCWRRGLERPLWLVLAGFLISLCALTKYFGVSLIPLLLAYSLLARKPLRPALTALLIPVAVLAGYQGVTGWLYGRGLLFDAVGFSLGARKDFGTGLLDPLIGLAFTGGCLAGVLFYLPLLWPPRMLLGAVGLAGAVLALAATIAGFGSHPLFGERSWDGAILLQAILLLLGGIGVLALVASDVWKRRDADAWLLFLWCAGTLAFGVSLNWVINGRSLLPLAPAVGILVARRLDLLRGSSAMDWREAWPLVPASVLALAVTAADCRQAEADRDAAFAIARACSGRPGTLWFEGHWGFQYYLQLCGGVPVNVDHPCFGQGDFLAIPGNNYGVSFTDFPETAQDILTVEGPPFPGLTTFNEERGAGFYTHVSGPFPFLFGPVPPVHYRVVRFHQ